MLSAQKIYAVFALSLIAGTAEATRRDVDYNSASTPYKLQEDNFYETPSPSHTGDRSKGIPLHAMYCLRGPDEFLQHKPTLFSRLNDKQHLDYLKGTLIGSAYAKAVGFGANITVEDAKAISLKQHSLNACHELAFLLMASPPKSLRGLSSDCVAEVAREALKASKTPTPKPSDAPEPLEVSKTISPKDMAASVRGKAKKTIAARFITNSYGLDKNIWDKNFELLHELTREEPGYAKYGALFEIFVKNDDRCRSMSANEALNTITTAQASKITRSSCFTSMTEMQKFIPDSPRKVTQLPKNVFADVDVLLHGKVYESMTVEQIHNFGMKHQGERCNYLMIHKLKNGGLGSIDGRCWSTYLTNYGDVSHAPKFGRRVRLIRPDSWKDVKTEGFSRIHQDDLQHVPTTIVNKFLEANPEFCEDLDKIDTEKVRIVVPECFIRLTGEQQMKVMEKRGSSFPVNILEKFTRETVEKFDSNMAFLRNVKFTPDQIKAIGRDCKKPEEHPCSALSKDDLLSTESLMGNMSEHCFAALACLDDLEPSDLSHLPKSLLALLPFDKLMLMIADDKEYFANLDAAGMKHLTSKDFCSKVPQSVFTQIKAAALASVDERCAAALTFKKSLTEAQIRAFSKRAFRLFTKDMTAELPAITTLTPEQFHELSADVKEVKQSAGQLLTKEVLAALPSEYIAQLSEELLGATPAPSFAAFSTKDNVVALPAASLHRVSAEQVKVIPAEALSALTVAQVQELGVALTEASTSPITHLLNDKNVKLSVEAQVAAVKRAEQDKERFAKSAAANKKDASSASTIGVSALGLVLAAAALAF